MKQHKKTFIFPPYSLVSSIVNILYNWSTLVANEKPTLVLYHQISSGFDLDFTLFIFSCVPDFNLEHHVKFVAMSSQSPLVSGSFCFSLFLMFLKALTNIVWGLRMLWVWVCLLFSAWGYWCRKEHQQVLFLSSHVGVTLSHGPYLTIFSLGTWSQWCLQAFSLQRSFVFFPSSGLWNRVTNCTTPQKVRGARNSAPPPGVEGTYKCSQGRRLGWETWQRTAAPHRVDKKQRQWRRSWEGR